MGQISKESFEKFKAIYKKEFGRKLSDEDARDQATRLLNICRVVLQPMPKAWEKQYKEALARVKKKSPKLK